MKMKNRNILRLLCLSTFFLHGCHCKTCIDNLTPINNKISYTNGELVAFVNDTLGAVFDTVHVSLGKPSSKQYNCSGNTDAGEEACTCWTDFFYSNFFYLSISQADNKLNNRISCSASNYNAGEKEEVVSYTYKNDILKAVHYYFPTDTFGSQIWKIQANKKDSISFVYDDYYYTVDKSIMLLQYSRVYKNGVRRVFKLQ